MQRVIDFAPRAKSYFSDAFNTYRELCWWGAHQSMYNKSQTSSVEGDNAELQHYLARLTRRSGCFSKCIDALASSGRVVRLALERAAELQATAPTLSE